MYCADRDGGSSLENFQDRIDEVILGNDTEEEPVDSDDEKEDE